MPSLPASATNDLAAVLAWIEQHLDEPLSLDRIAARAGLSAYHFSRLFTACTGRSVMAHVRARRLLKAAQRLTGDADLRLVELAFDCGFESQEAFTRAFKRRFGVSPGRFRKGIAIPPMEGPLPMNIPNDANAAVALLPDRVRLETFTVAGPSRRFDDASKAEIPQLWTQLIAALPFEGQTPNWATYGVVWAVDRGEGSFSYMAGVEVKPEAQLPQGFERIGLPAASYAVFRIVLDGGPLHAQIKAAMAKIWGELIPASGLRVAPGPDFERYDSTFAPTRPGAIIDFHVPVEA